MEENKGYKCPLCSYSFKVGEAKCGACPMSKGCKIICCPHCGYQWVEESKAVNLIKKLMGKK